MEFGAIKRIQTINTPIKIKHALCILVVVAISCAKHQEASFTKDKIVFGNLVSEQAHRLAADNSDIVDGAKGMTARVLLPAHPVNWEGGRLGFTMKVDPKNPNYLTAKFWGGESNTNRLVLFAEGKQIGYYHLGDYDILYIGGKDPACPGKFFYHTCPLPTDMTRNRHSLQLEIRSRGPIWPYGNNFNQFQHHMTTPSAGIYAIYIHSEGYFDIQDKDVSQRHAPRVKIRKGPGAEVMDSLKLRVDHTINQLLKSEKRLTQHEMVFLARAWYAPWSVAWHNPDIVEVIRNGIDDFYQRSLQSSDLIVNDHETYNPGWFGTGQLAYAVALLDEQLKSSYEKILDAGNSKYVKRRDAWAGLFYQSREFLRHNRRQYTNQGMIIDWNIYLSNKGLKVLLPDSAMDGHEINRYLYEAIGLQPWLGSDTQHGSSRPLGDQYYQITRKGLTKELGYVGNYGEVLDWVTQIYLATCDSNNLDTGDPLIRQQLAKMAKARSYFRYPAVDAEGYRAMRLQTVVGWRDHVYPGDVVYAERLGWDASPFWSVAATMDDHGLGAAYNMLKDMQFFNSLKEKMETYPGHFRVTQSLLPVPEQYERVLEGRDSGLLLPMAEEQPDFVFSDEEAGVIAIKNGHEILYGSLWWRAKRGVNGLARFHHITSGQERVATIRQQPRFKPSSFTWERPNWTNFGFADWGPEFPEALHSAHAGELLPVAKIPDDVSYTPGSENSFAGRSDLYTLTYGNYFIAMNCTDEYSFDVKIPKGFRQGRELTTAGYDACTDQVILEPASSLVIFKK